MKNILIVILTLGFISCIPSKKEITEVDLERMLMHDSISGILVNRNYEAEIKVRSQNKNDMPYVLKIESPESFQKLLSKIKNKLHKQNIYPKYESVIYKSSNLEYIIYALLILSVSFIFLFLYAIVNLLKHRFENSIDKLIWFLVVLIPLLGPILYLVIGKKQTQK